MELVFALKIAATVAVVIATALAAERAGPFIGALIACLPVSAGPAYVLLAMQSDDAFIAASALTSTAAVAATGMFLIAYTRLGPRAGLATCLAGAFAVWLAAAAAIHEFDWNAAGVVVLNALVFGTGIAVTRVGSGGNRPPRAPRRWYDLPLQAALIGGLTAVVITVGKWAGPTTTGLLALFPVVFTSVALILHPRLGGAGAAATMAGALRAMPGFALALLVVHLASVPLGRAAALALGLTTTLAWSGALLLRHAQAARRRQAIR